MFKSSFQLSRFLVISFFLPFIGVGQSDVIEIPDFGKNKGNLTMYLHVNNTIKTKKLPLVVVLHGCSQNAQKVAEQSGWNKLADQYGFIVLYPEQKRANNMSNCFNWFNKKDIDPNNGESSSILEMIAFTKANYAIDSTRIFIYGLSAGAAMTVNLMANSPTTFNTGASFAGGAYGIAQTFLSASSAMSNPPAKSPEEWADLVPRSDTYPRLIVGHGTKDNVVDFQNAQELIKQWTYLHQLDFKDGIPEPSFAQNKRITRTSYRDSLMNERVIFYELKNAGHALPVDPGDGNEQGGETGMFAEDYDFFSTYYVAKDFGLLD